MKSRFHNVAGLIDALMVLVASGGMHAQEVYAGVGLFGAQIGYAHALSPSLTVRGDYMTLGSRSQTTNESGTEYWNCKVVLADWSPLESSTFRITGDATVNSIVFDLTTGGANTRADINGKSYALGVNDWLNMQIKMPNIIPFVGIGWAHKQGDKSWGFHFDLGLRLAKLMSRKPARASWLMTENWAQPKPMWTKNG